MGWLTRVCLLTVSALLQNTLVFHGNSNGAAILSIPHRKKDFTHRATYVGVEQMLQRAPPVAELR